MLWPATSARSARLRVIWIILSLTKEIACSRPRKDTVELETNPLPFTVSVSGPVPAVADIGEMLEIEGCGFGTIEIVKLTAGEIPPPGDGFVTITPKFPTLARSDAFRLIVNLESSTKEATRGDPLNVTDEEERNPVPLIVRVSEADPAGAEGGDRLVIKGWMGGKGPTAIVTVFDFTPPIETTTGTFLPDVIPSGTLAFTW
jgi:hypothetical protein